MKKHIIIRLKEKLELKQREWADNYISKLFNEVTDTKEAKVNVDKAVHNMSVIEKDIEWLKATLKHESKGE